MRQLRRLTILLIFLIAAGVEAQSLRHHLPMPVPLPPTVETPKDTLYPGTIQLRIDATDVLRRIYQIQETIPVKKAGPITLLFPQWTPGDHAPNEPLEKLAGLVIFANGNRLHWVRDSIAVHAFHVDVPYGATTLDLHYQYLGSTDPSTGPVLITPTMLDLQWQSVILYPAGCFARDITYQASVKFPTGWTFLTSIDGATESSGTISFPPLSLDSLVDQPVMAGRYLKRLILATNPVPVRLDVAVQEPDDIAALANAVKTFTPLMEQAKKLFGSHHYDHYDHMLFLSDELSTYFEHHRSGENAAPSNFLKVVAKTSEDQPNLSFIAHGYVHSWNGMYRRPAEMWTPNLNTPERDSMLWVFEGLTSYWADVLCARAGMFTKGQSDQVFSNLAARMTLDVGAEWRTLQDANNDPLIIAREPTSWASWQRNMFDAYDAGEMIWLEADAIIRQESQGDKSLDDFARSFFSGNDAGNTTKTYTFSDMVFALNKVQHYDWRTFFRSRLDDYGEGHLIHGIDRTGYTLVFADKPMSAVRPSNVLDLEFSLGMRVSPTGRIRSVRWGGPAYKANLTTGETIVSVNGTPYDPASFTKAINEAVNGGSLDVVVSRGTWQQTTSIEWRGGLRYPHLQRSGGDKPALLDQILSATN